MPKKIIAFVSSENSLGKSDATGAFIPESIKFLGDIGMSNGSKRIGLNLSTKDVHQRLAYSLAAIDTQVSQGITYDCVAFFCHGWQKGLQLGVSLDLGMAEFAASIKKLLNPKGVVALYACSTAGDNDGNDDEKIPTFSSSGGFAYELAKLLPGMAVFGHTIPGHTTTNPYAQRFCTEENGGNGQWYVVPGSMLWSKYTAAMRGPFRFQVPFMKSVEVLEVVKRFK